MSSDESSLRTDTIHDRNHGVTCYCGWEAKFGYGVAVTLAVFEAKRFLMLILEVLADWQVIRFAGGLKPLLLSLADIGVGLPIALTTIRAIRPRKYRDCYVGKKRTLAWLRFAIAFCALMNVTTLVSIGYHIKIKRTNLIEVFNTSMRLYMNSTSSKYSIDQIQFDFQCCGYASYEDWLLFDWQQIDYTSREEMAQQDLLSDEEMRDRSVPFSCCTVEAMAPCVHTEFTGADIATINMNGCVTMLSPVLLRIVIVAYLVTSTLLVTQIILTFLVTKVTRKLLPVQQKYNYMHAADPPCTIPFNSTSSAAENHGSSSSLSGYESGRRGTRKKGCTVIAKKIKRGSIVKCTRRRSTNDPCYEFPESSDSDVPYIRYPPCAMQEAARIEPSVEEQHEIPRKSLPSKAR